MSQIQIQKYQNSPVDLILASEEQVSATPFFASTAVVLHLWFPCDLKHIGGFATAAFAASALC